MRQRRQPKDYWPLITRLYNIQGKLTYGESCFISNCDLARRTYGQAMVLSGPQFDWLDKLKTKYKHLIEDNHGKG